MIRCDGFGKLLKQGFFTLLISCFILLGGSFVNAGYTQDVGLIKYNSIYDSSFELGFLKGGGVLTNFLGQGRPFLAFDSSTFFWRATNGQPYFYSPEGQGFFSHYTVCDELTGETSTPTNCTFFPIEGDFKSLFKGFFSTIGNGDWAFYDITHSNGGHGCSIRMNRDVICFSSHQIGKSICFNSSSCYYGCQGNPCPNFCDSVGGCGGRFVNSQNLANLSFGLIANSWIGPAPGQFGYDGEYEGEGSQGSIDIGGSNSSQLTGDYLYSTCTYGEIVDYLNQGDRSPYFCYGGLDNFDLYNPEINYNPIPGTGKTLNQILVNAQGTWSTPSEWYNFRNGLYGDSKYDSMWSSYPAVYHTWFDLFKQYGGGWQGFDNVLEYCNIITNLDSLSGSVYRGHNEALTRSCNTIIDNKNNILLGGSGGIINGINRGSNVKPQTNAVEFIQNFFNKAQEVIPTNYQDIGGFGFLPVYIITFLCALIFFRFIFH